VVNRRQRAGRRPPKALVIAYAVHETGRGEVIGIDLSEAETEAFWRDFLRSLRARGLSGVKLCVSDAHTGFFPNRRSPIYTTNRDLGPSAGAAFAGSIRLCFAPVPTPTGNAMPATRLFGEKRPASEEGDDGAPLRRLGRVTGRLVAGRANTRCRVWILAVSVRLCLHVEPSIHRAVRTAGW
jgi:Transposase, Mutator family